MTIDIKRLAVDAKYWKERGAPDDATHCAVHKPGKTWFKTDAEGNVYEWHMRFSEWQEGACENKLVRLIPRPQPQPEWVDGLPGAGVECEYRPDPIKRPEWWDKCIYLTHYDGEHFVIVSETNNLDRMRDGIHASERFRPIPTPGQRKRDELIAALKDFDKQRSVAWREDAADFILSRYNLEKRP